jgi:hypothetical protein
LEARVGYVIAVAINAVLLILINVSPGWQTLPWITDSFTQVLGLLNLSIWLNLLANMMYLVYDGRRFKAATQAVLLAVSLAVTVRLLAVFPFDFTSYSFNWGALMRVVLIIGIAGSAIGIVSSIVQAVRPGRPGALDT